MKPDLQIEQNNVRKLLENNGSLKRIYKELRGKTRLRFIGDYPMISFICKEAKKIGIEVNKKSIVDALKIARDGEFKGVRQNSEIVRQLCA